MLTCGTDSNDLLTLSICPTFRLSFVRPHVRPSVRPSVRSSVRPSVRPSVVHIMSSVIRRPSINHCFLQFFACVRCSVTCGGARSDLVGSMSLPRRQRCVVGEATPGFAPLPCARTERCRVAGRPATSVRRTWPASTVWRTTWSPSPPATTTAWDRPPDTSLSPRPVSGATGLVCVGYVSGVRPICVRYNILVPYVLFNYVMSDVSDILQIYYANTYIIST